MRDDGLIDNLGDAIADHNELQTLAAERNKVVRKYRMFHDLADKYENNKNLSDFHGGVNKSAFKNDEPHRFAKEVPPKYPNTNVPDRRENMQKLPLLRQQLKKQGLDIVHGIAVGQGKNPVVAIKSEENKN